MDIKHIDDQIAVTGQVRPEEVAAVAAAGFRALIVNRPDGEGGAGQPTFAEIAAAAERAGLAAHYIPVRPGQATPADVAAFDEALATLPKPILAFCRSGARSTMLWSMSAAGRTGMRSAR